MTCNNWNYRKTTKGVEILLSMAKKTEKSTHLVTRPSCLGKDLRTIFFPLQCSYRRVQAQKLTELYAGMLCTSPCGYYVCSSKKCQRGLERDGSQVNASLASMRGWKWCQNPYFSFVCLSVCLFCFFKKDQVWSHRFVIPALGKWRHWLTGLVRRVRERLSQKRAVLTWGTTRRGCSLNYTQTRACMHTHPAYTQTHSQELAEKGIR